MNQKVANNISNQNSLPSIDGLLSELIKKSNSELSSFKITNPLIGLLRKGADSPYTTERVKAMLAITLLLQRNNWFRTKFEATSTLGKKVGDKSFIFMHYTKKRYLDIQGIVKRKEPTHCDKPLFFSMALSQYPVGLVVPYSAGRIKQMIANGEFEKIPDPFLSIIWTKKVDWEPEAQKKLTKGSFPVKTETEEETQKIKIKNKSFRRIELPKQIKIDGRSPSKYPATQKNRIASIEDLLLYSMKGSATTKNKMFCFTPVNLTAMTPLNYKNSKKPRRKKKRKKMIIRGFTERLEDLELRENTDLKPKHSYDEAKPPENSNNSSTKSTLRNGQKNGVEKHFEELEDITPIQSKNELKTQEKIEVLLNKEEKRSEDDHLDLLLNNTLEQAVKEREDKDLNKLFNPNLSGVLGSKFTKECCLIEESDEEDPLGSPLSEKAQRDQHQYFYKSNVLNLANRAIRRKPKNESLIKQVLIQNNRREKTFNFRDEFEGWRNASNAKESENGFKNFRKQKQYNSFKFQRKRVKIKRTVTPQNQKPALPQRRATSQYKKSFERSPGEFRIKNRVFESPKFRSKSENKPNQRGRPKLVQKAVWTKIGDQVSRRNRSYDPRKRKNFDHSSTHDRDQKQFRINSKRRKIKEKSMLLGRDPREPLNKGVSLLKKRPNRTSPTKKIQNEVIQQQEALLRKKINSINSRNSVQEESTNTALQTMTGSFFKVKSRPREKRKNSERVGSNRNRNHVKSKNRV